MSAKAHRALTAACKARQFPPAYYFHGDDDFRKDGALRLVLDCAVDASTRDFNLDVRRGAELTPETLSSLLSTPPMMAERRAVVVRDVSALKKDARAALDRHLAQPSPDVLVVLVAPAGAKPDAALARVAEAVPFDLLGEGELPEWIVRHARRELGVAVADDAAALLAGAVGSDLQQLAQELDKLASYVRGAGAREGSGAGSGGDVTVDVAAVEAVVGVRRGETLGDLLDAVARQDARQAVALVPHVLALPKSSAVTVVMALATQTLALAWGEARRADGIPAGAMSNEFFGFLKQQPSAYLGRPWGEAVRAWCTAVDRWPAASLDRALRLLLDADVALKETRVSSDEQMIATLVLGLCALPGRASGRRAA
jgi:DNA polymerase-3 subunit delta